jgi:enolase-phosphatase E1
MDIEGTIIPIAFVRGVLFPYAKQRMTRFLNEHQSNPAVRQWAALCQDASAEESGIRPSYDELPGILQLWMEADAKQTGLKGLQGMIWEEGYKGGAFAPALYDDVLPALISWRAQGIQLALYSSGSEQAQRLLMTYTTKGDLTGYFVRFFDTSVGSKTNRESYCRIATTLGMAADTILFLSDIETELDAAAATSFKTTQIVRPGTQTGGRHAVAPDLLNLPLFCTQDTPPRPAIKDNI